jgi:hypothetical protein
MASNKKSPSKKSGDPIAALEKQLAALKEALHKVRARWKAEADKAVVQTAAGAKKATAALQKAEARHQTLAARYKLKPTADLKKQVGKAQQAVSAAGKALNQSRADAAAALRAAASLGGGKPAPKRPASQPKPATAKAAKAAPTAGTAKPKTAKRATRPATAAAAQPKPSSPAKLTLVKSTPAPIAPQPTAATPAPAAKPVAPAKTPPVTPPAAPVSSTSTPPAPAAPPEPADKPEPKPQPDDRPMRSLFDPIDD